MNIVKILLAEDEELIRSTLSLNLEIEGFRVESVNNGRSALAAFEKDNFQLIILDVMMPELGGFEVCEEIRRKNTEIPILFLTALSDSEQKIKGLKLGADDYITKPFSLEEFLLRVKILLKRNKINEIPSVYEFSYFIINFDSFEIKRKDKTIANLSKREINLLQLLIEQKNKVVSRDEILEKIWEIDENPSSRTIDNIILNFRKIFETNPKAPKHFHSIRGVGYKFTP